MRLGLRVLFSPLAALPLVLLLGSCGGDDDASSPATASEAGPPDAHPSDAPSSSTDGPAVPTQGPFGEISFTDVKGAGGFLTAGFYENTAQAANGCTTTAIGACTIATCDPNADATPPPLPQAGIVFFSGGTLPEAGLGLVPQDGGVYGTAQHDSPLFAAGDMLQAKATGGDVPAFSGTVVGPAAVTLTAPVADGGRHQIDTSSELPVAWTGGETGATVAVQLVAFKGSTPISIGCRFDAAAGSGTVPKAVIAQLAGSTGSLYVSQLRASSLDAGRFAVRLVAAVEVTSLAEYR